MITGFLRLLAPNHHLRLKSTLTVPRAFFPAFSEPHLEWALNKFLPN